MRSLWPVAKLNTRPQLGTVVQSRMTPQSGIHRLRSCADVHKSISWHCLNVSDRLAWALVHSEKRSDVDRGIEILGALLSVDDVEKRELEYLLAVGQYRRRYYLDARSTLKELLKVRDQGGLNQLVGAPFIA